jgi:hypothetical protein
MDPSRPFRTERDIPLFEDRLEIDLDSLAITPANRNPRVLRNEGIFVAFVDHGNLVAASQLVAKFICHDRAAKARTQYHYMRH